MLEIKYPGGAGLEVRSALSDRARECINSPLYYL